MKRYRDLFDRIIAPENLFDAWEKFSVGKRNKSDVMQFERNLEENMFMLYRELRTQRYRHKPYTGFFITDPKQRHIHKATIRDRVIHHALVKVLEPIFEPTFIYDSYSCRKRKGTHRGIARLATFLRKVSKNNHHDCIVLKCDVKKFFQSIDHDLLLGAIGLRIADERVQWLVREIVESFSPGLPIGNLTSQLFANIYLSALDQFVKHTLHIPFYLRYTDDFVIVVRSQDAAEKALAAIKTFLKQELRLDLHPNKIEIRAYHRGIDFLGYIQFPHHRILRITTKRRIIKNVVRGKGKASLASYLGVLSHAHTYRLSQFIKNIFWSAESKNEKPPIGGVDTKDTHITVKLPKKNYDGWMDGWKWNVLS